jgi:hypothetical protein
MIYKNKKNNVEILIDGSIIAKNPSLYSFIYAQNDTSQEEVFTRIISIGNGVSKPSKIDPKSAG